MKSWILHLLLGLSYFSCANYNSNSVKNTSNETIRDTIWFNGTKQIKATGFLKNGLRGGVWKIYTKEGELDSVLKYKDGIVIKVLDSKDFKLVHVQIKEISIELPMGWKMIKNYNNTIFIARKYLNDSIIPSPTINVMKTTSNSSLEDFVITSKKEYQPEDSACFYAERKITINGFIAYQLVTSNKKPDGLKIISLQTIYKYGTTFYVLTEGDDVSSGLFDDYENLYEDIAESFKVLTFVTDSAQDKRLNKQLGVKV